MNFIYQKNINLAFFVMLVTFSTHAAAPGGGPPPPTAPTPVGLPIDGSIMILFFVAVIYAVYSMKKSQINIKQ